MDLKTGPFEARLARDRLDVEHDRPSRVRAARIKIGHLPPGHQRDDMIKRRRVHLSRADRLTVFQHRIAVAQLATLFEKMTDIDNAHPLRPQPENRREEFFRVGPRETTRWLIHNQHLRLDEQGAGNLDHLLLRDGERSGAAVQSDALVP